MPQLEVRRAREEDRAAVLAFCQQTWEWGDYIEYVWEQWLHDQRGALFVATMDEQPVGVAHLEMLNASEAWMEGMRVDPQFRKHGVASALFDAQISEATRRGAAIARLLTDSTNTAAIRLIERSKMRRTGSFAPYHAFPIDALAGRQRGLDAPVLATPADLDEVIEYLNHSNILPIMGGVYYRGFTAYSLTRELIAEKIDARQVYLLRRWQRVDGLAIAEVRERRDEKVCSLGYIDGATADSIGLIAYALRAMLPDLGVNKAWANVPDLLIVRDAFAGAEYEWDGSVFYLYEQQLP